MEDGKPEEIKARLLKKSVSFRLEGDTAAAPTTNIKVYGGKKVRGTLIICYRIPRQSI